MRGERSMAQIVIVAHAPLASSLQAVAQHVYPDAGQRLTAVDVPAGAGLDEVERSLREALAPMLERGDEVLLLLDVFAATPCNAARAHRGRGQRADAVAYALLRLDAAGRPDGPRRGRGEPGCHARRCAAPTEPGALGLIP